MVGPDEQQGAEIRYLPAPELQTGWRAVRKEVLFRNRLGRIRAVAMGPDGHLYFTTSNRDGRGDAGPGDDYLLRIRPRR